MGLISRVSSRTYRASRYRLISKNWKILKNHGQLVAEEEAGKQEGAEAGERRQAQDCLELCEDDRGQSQGQEEVSYRYRKGPHRVPLKTSRKNGPPRNQKPRAQRRHRQVDTNQKRQGLPQQKTRQTHQKRPAFHERPHEEHAQQDRKGRRQV